MAKEKKFQTLIDFCDIATEVYEIEKDKQALISSFSKELDLDNCFKYVGYIDNKPAGTIEFSEGKEAAYRRRAELHKGCC